MAKCVINRRAEFSASHRYWLSEIPDEQNIARFGACTNFPPHGHNYVLYVGMQGEIDHTGMVLNLSDVKHTIAREVTTQLNFSYLNQVWEEFQLTLPTTENVARVIWQRLESHLPLVNIRLYEHPELWADYQGNDMQVNLTISTHFSAAHRLALDSLSLEANTEIYGKCARVNGHGHNYHLEISIAGDIDPRSGMIVDLTDFQNAVKEYILDPMDHTFLNKDILYFAEVVPTAENIAVYIQKVLTQPIRNIGAKLHSIKLIESPNNSCEVYGEYELTDAKQSLEEALAKSV
jgi:6-pyruvoyltetrahydropterin/6-carboxytetrahydropterin synthase